GTDAVLAEPDPGADDGDHHALVDRHRPRYEGAQGDGLGADAARHSLATAGDERTDSCSPTGNTGLSRGGPAAAWLSRAASGAARIWGPDRKSTRLNSSHVAISYAVFCLKKKKIQDA